MGIIVELKQNQEELIDDYFKMFTSKNTINNYLIDIKDFFQVDNVYDVTLYMMKQTDLDSIKEFIYRLIEEKKALNTIKRRISSLTNFYEYLMSEKIIINNSFEDNKNIIKKIIKNKCNKNDDEFVGRALSIDEIRKYLNSIDIGKNSKRDRLMIEIMFKTGLRRDEIVNIKTENIEWNELEKSYYLLVQGKGRKKRLVKISEKLVNKIKDYKSSGIIFDLSENYINKLFDKYNKISGIEITPHDTRRTFACLLADNGVPISTIQKVLGHTSITTTEIYIKGRDKYKQDILEIINMIDEI